MDPVTLYNVWAPEESLWSNWVKPVLFAQTEYPVRLEPPTDWRLANLAWAPSVDERAAIILDLDDALGVWAGMALADRGFRPVPLYNGAPGISAVIDVDRIIAALREVAPALSGMPIQPDAPPVFLLDAKRAAGSSYVSPGRFDNRWVVFPQDFPSANFLLSNGIQKVVVAQMSPGDFAADLSHVLLRWQESGIQIWSCDVRGDSALPVRVSRPPWFRMLWYRAMVIAGLRRHSGGGFGAVVPEPSQSSGFS